MKQLALLLITSCPYKNLFSNLWSHLHNWQEIASNLTGSIEWTETKSRGNILASLLRSHLNRAMWKTMRDQLRIWKASFPFNCSIAAEHLCFTPIFALVPLQSLSHLHNCMRNLMPVRSTKICALFEHFGHFSISLMSQSLIQCTN